MVKAPKKIGFFTILKYGGRAMTSKKEDIADIPLFIKEKCSEFFNTKHDTNLIIDLCLFA